jgi:hypothetical protein
LARELGPVGVSCSEEDQARLLAAARSLKDLPGPFPTNSVPLTGLHRLVYSAAPGGSSGKIGPLVGTVTQEFVNATHFINAVAFGPLRLELLASRKLVKDNCINVFFHETTITLFGITLLTKPASGGGQWNCVWAGAIPADDDDDDDSSKNKKKLIRIMETPSLFVLEHDLVD